MDKLICIHPEDNVWVVRIPIAAGERIWIGDTEVLFSGDLSFGHKVAAQYIARGNKVIKFGVPIGSATQDIYIGEHVHLHNLKSDYLPTYTLENKGYEE